VKDGKYVKRPDTPEHNWLWAPTGVIDAHMPEMWGYLIFTDSGEDYPLPEADEVPLLVLVTEVAKFYTEKLMKKIIAQKKLKRID